MKTLIEQIDDNTYSINGRTFKHTGEDVRSPMEQNVAEVRYTVEYCKANDVYVLVPEFNQFERVAEICSQKWINGHNLWHHHKKEAAYNIARKSVYAKSGLRHDASIVIDFATFIAHNTQVQDKVLFVTEDGVNIYPSQIFCYVPKENTVIFTEAYEVLPINFFERTKEGKLFGTEQAAQAYIDSQKPQLPTLAEVFKKVQPKYCLTLENAVRKFGGNIEGSRIVQNHLSTEAQCEQLQSYIALRVISDWANGEASWMPKSGKYYMIGIKDNNFITKEYPMVYDRIRSLMGVYFKQREHAEQAISILKEAGLLNALKG